MSDLHAGSHADDVARLTAIVKQAAAFKPDLVLHGGDFVNMQLFGGRRLSPYAIARILASQRPQQARRSVAWRATVWFGNQRFKRLA